MLPPLVVTHCVVELQLAHLVQILMMMKVDMFPELRGTEFGCVCRLPSLAGTKILALGILPKCLRR